MQTDSAIIKSHSIPVLNIDLHVAPDFTGRAVIHFNNGRAICERRLMPDEHILSLDGFLELAQMAGYSVKE